MRKIGLEDIRRANIRQIFALIEKNPKISRLEIANDTGLSLMTVGKIIDSFEKNGIVILEASGENKVGRRAKHITLDQSKCELVIAVKDGGVSVSIYDFALNRLAEYRGELADIDGLMLEAMKAAVSKMIIGVGIIGDDIGVSDGVAESFGTGVHVCVSHETAKAYAAVISSAISVEQVMYVCADTMQSVLFCGGEAECSGGSTDRQIAYESDKIFAIAAATKFALPNLLLVNSSARELPDKVAAKLAELGESDISVAYADGDPLLGAAYIVRDAYIADNK